VLLKGEVDLTANHICINSALTPEGGLGALETKFEALPRKCLFCALGPDKAALLL
jgi:hypothetical protein